VNGPRSSCCRPRGSPLTAISTATGLSPQAASKWRRRYLEAGLDGLADLPRSGRPARIGPEARLAVLALASSKPPDGSTRWSTRRLAEQHRPRATSVHRILHEG
jgi:transposase